MINNEILVKISEFLSSSLLWLYFASVILFFYLVLALFTWSFKRPLKFLGIPSIITGILLIASYFIIGIIPLNDTLIKIIVSSSKPVFNTGLICLIMGIVMLVLHKIIGTVFDKRKEEKESEITKSGNEDESEENTNLKD